MRIFGPLVCSSTSAATATFSSALASAVTFAPSTTRATGSETLAPGSESSFSTLTMSPTATLYCLPPVLTIAYVAVSAAIVPLQSLGARYQWCARGSWVRSHVGPAVVGVSRKTTGPGYVRPAYRVKSPQVTVSAVVGRRARGTHGRAAAMTTAGSGHRSGLFDPLVLVCVVLIRVVGIVVV